MLETTESKKQRPDDSTIGTMAADLALWLDEQVDEWFNSKDLNKEYDISGDWVIQALHRGVDKCKWELTDESSFESAFQCALDEADDDEWDDEDD